jgi:2-dehydro-3-deoxygalactonokinase
MSRSPSAAPAPPVPAAWLAVDWGGSRLRVWAMDERDRPLGRVSCDRGASTLTRGEFDAALRDVAAPWLAEKVPLTAVACGMVGARQGWVEAPYRSVPCPPLGPGAARVRSENRDLIVRILPGLSQQDPPDVMRGEETKIAGALATLPGFEGVVCLPGTHAKWATVSGGAVVGFRTFMTGELFALLSTRSSLRHALPDGTGWDDAAFAGAVRDAAAAPGRLTTQLFGVRAMGLVAGLSPAAARARLSGLLIGAEVAAARDLWEGAEVALVGAERLADAYAAALGALGGAARRLPVEETTLAGLSAARAMLEAAS